MTGLKVTEVNVHVQGVSIETNKKKEEVEQQNANEQVENSNEENQ